MSRQDPRYKAKFFKRGHEHIIWDVQIVKYEVFLVIVRRNRIKVSNFNLLIYRVLPV